MSKQIVETLSLVAFCLYFLLMAITPIAIIVLGIINMTRDKNQQGVNALQAVAALVVWAMLSGGTLMAFIMTVYSYPVNSGLSNEITSNAIFIVGGVVYFVACAALIFWTKRMTRRMPAMGISC